MPVIKEAVAQNMAGFLVQPLDARGQRAASLDHTNKLRVNLHLLKNDMFIKARFHFLLEEGVGDFADGRRVEAICSIREESLFRTLAEVMKRSYLFVSPDLRWVNNPSRHRLNSADNGLLIVPQFSITGVSRSPTEMLCGVVERFKSERLNRMQIRNVLAVVGGEEIDIAKLQKLGVEQVVSLTDLSYIQNALSAGIT